MTDTTFELLLNIKDMAADQVNRVRTQLSEDVKTAQAAGLEYQYLQGVVSGLNMADRLYSQLCSAMETVRPDPNREKPEINVPF